MGTKGTPNYVYFVDEVLGVGSTASVYVGRNKKTGQLCAMKVYSDLSSDPSREFQTMQILNHENIIKFIAVETESASKGKVLIMELSTGGSVLNMLEKPEFALGFPDEEFLVFLRDTTSALRYLRENKIVHRDIKPGNILRFIKEDMSSQYKITDFGAARELDDSDQFLSIYGTEEYLEPTAYRQALLPNRRPVNSFNASVDLWSLGVTLYHVATGNLPFQPFGGRKNREEMYSITSAKQSGVISGVQREPDGPIEWSSDLPGTCPLSRSLKKRLKKILSNLLECDTKRRWSFENFFKHSVNITSRRALRIILLGELEAAMFYAAPEDLESLSNFRSFLVSEAKLFSPSDMKFCHPHVSLEEVFMYFLESSANRLHLYAIPESPEVYQWRHVEPQLPLKMPVAPSSSSMRLDCTFALKSLAFVCFLERRCDDIIRLVEYLDAFFHVSWKDFIREVMRYGKDSEIAFSNFAKLSSPASSKKENTKVKPITENGCQEKRPSSESSDQLAPTGWSRMLPPKVSCKASWEVGSAGSLFSELMREKRNFYTQLNASKEMMTIREKKKLVKIGDDLKEIVQKFQKQAELERKDLMRLTHNELQIHKFDKKRILKLMTSAEKLHVEIAKHMADYSQKFKSWFISHNQKMLTLSSRSPPPTSPKVQIHGLRTTTTTTSHHFEVESFPFADLENSIFEQLDKMMLNEESLKALVREQSDQVKTLHDAFTICMG